MVGLPCAFAQTAGQRPPIEWRGAYAGEMITHPGAAIGLAQVLTMSQTWSGFRHALVLTPEIGWYDHPRNNIGVFCDVALGWRLSHRSGAQFSVSAGAGYLRTWLDGRVYEVDDSGVHRVRDWGRSNLMLSLPVEFGWYLPLAQQGRWIKPFLQLTPFVRYPYNGTFLPQGLMEIGIAFPWSLFDTQTQAARQP
jgi:hypothetical protein